jgi:hypothetical protein
MTNSTILALMSILLGIILAGVGIRYCLRIMIMMSWLNTRVIFRMLGEEKQRPEEINYTVSTVLMCIASFFPFLGIALILVGIKFL